MNWDHVNGAITAGLSALIGTAFAGLMSLIAVWFRRKANQIGRSAFLSAMSWVSTVRRAYREFNQLEFAHRVLLLVALTETRRAGTICHVRAMDGWTHRESVDDPFETYSHQITADKHYLDVLDLLARQQRVLLTVSEMPQESVLRGYYANEKVVQTALYLLKDFGDGHLLFMDVASYSQEFELYQLDRLRIMADRVKATLEDQ